LTRPLKLHQPVPWIRDGEAEAVEIPFDEIRGLITGTKVLRQLDFLRLGTGWIWFEMQNPEAQWTDQQLDEAVWEISRLGNQQGVHVRFDAGLLSCSRTLPLSRGKRFDRVARRSDARTD
jgi:hypothetical protein